MKKIIVIFCFLASVALQGQNSFVVARQLFNSGNLQQCQLVLDTCTAYRDSVLYLKAYIQLKNNRVAEAQKLCAELQRTNKDFYEVWFLKGLISSMRQNYPLAAEQFTKVINENKTHVKALYNRALVKGLLEDNAGAVADLDACLKVDTAYAAAYYSRGYWHEASGNYEKARRDYMHTIALDPAYKEAYLALAYVLNQQGDKQKACETLDIAIEKGVEAAHDLKENFCKP